MHEQVCDGYLKIISHQGKVMSGVVAKEEAELMIKTLDICEVDPDLLLVFQQRITAARSSLRLPLDKLCPGLQAC